MSYDASVNLLLCLEWPIQYGSWLHSIICTPSYICLPVSDRLRLH